MNAADEFQTRTIDGVTYHFAPCDIPFEKGVHHVELFSNIRSLPEYEDQTVHADLLVDGVVIGWVGIIRHVEGMHAWSRVETVLKNGETWWTPTLAEALAYVPAFQDSP